jgi:putative hemolysin
VAFFSLKPTDLEKLKFTRPLSAHRIISILKTPSKLLITVLISNTLVNITLAIIAAFLTLSLIEHYHFNKALSIVIEIVLVTLVLLVFGEVTPKIIARRFALSFAIFGAIPLSFLIFVFFPITKILEWMSRQAQSLFRYDKRKSAINPEEIKHLNEIVENQSNFDSTTRQLLQSIGELNLLTVKDILIPRTNILGYDIALSVNNLKDIIEKSKHNFIPVYENNLDNIIGVLNPNDILRDYYTNNLTEQAIRVSLIKVNNVPETKPLIDLLKEFQLSRTQIAIVIDEHGGTVGLITFRDILNHLAGYNIARDIDLGIKKVDQYTYICDSSSLIKDIENKLDVELEIEGTGLITIGGFVVHQFGHVPKLGDEIKYKNLTFKVLELRGNRLRLFKILLRK